MLLHKQPRDTSVHVTRVINEAVVSWERTRTLQWQGGFKTTHRSKVLTTQRSARPISSVFISIDIQLRENLTLVVHTWREKQAQKETKRFT